MGKKVSKSNTPVWVWVIIFIILLQIAKLAHRNEWFSNKNPNLKNKEDFKKFMEINEDFKKFMDSEKNKQKNVSPH